MRRVGGPGLTVAGNGTEGSSAPGLSRMNATDHSSHKEQGSMIRCYIIQWALNRGYSAAAAVDRANVPDAALVVAGQDVNDVSRWQISW